MDKWQPVKYKDTDPGSEKYSKSTQFHRRTCTHLNHSVCMMGSTVDTKSDYMTQLLA